MREPEIGTGVVVRSFEEPSWFYVGLRQGSHAAGHLALPGGKMDAKDKSPLHAAKREIEEEMGILGFNWRPIPFWSWDTFGDTDRRFLVVYYECILKRDELPRLMEPKKCKGWVELNAEILELRREPLFSGLQGLLDGGHLR